MTWIQTASGRAVNLLCPLPEDIDFHVDIPEALARVARFTGHVRSGPYSTCQHSVMGCDAILRETKRPEVALAFLLHDAKEAYVGDQSTPLKRARQKQAKWLAAPTLLPYGEIVAETDRFIEERFDRLIHEAAGMNWPLNPEIKKLVKDYDIRMLATERKLLLGPSPRPWGEDVENAKLIRLPKKFTIWPWPQAADEFRSRLADLCPRLFH